MRTFVDIWNGMEPAGRQAPNSPSASCGGASSHPLQLVGEMEVGATATTTYYGVTQQLLEQEALASLVFLDYTTFTCLSSCCQLLS